MDKISELEKRGNTERLAEASQLLYTHAIRYKALLNKLEMQNTREYIDLISDLNYIGGR